MKVSGLFVLFLVAFSLACTKAEKEESPISVAAPIPKVSEPWSVPVNEKRVGIFYHGWHAYAATAQRRAQQAGKSPLTVEAVIRNPIQFFSDIYTQAEREVANSFYYHTQPEAGFYCIYRRRPGELGTVPDCPGIGETLERHARQLYGAGVDHVVVDATNLWDLNHPQADTIQLRPFEVLLEEWAQLRERRIATPEVAIWIPVPDPKPGEDPTYRHFLKLYNHPNYADLILRDRKTNKKLLFVVDPRPSQAPLDKQRYPSQRIMHEIEKNGGRDDISVIRMWAWQSPEEYASGKWAFVSPCGGESFSNDVLNPECDQSITTQSPVGSSLTVAASYHNGFASLPFHASGQNGGLTLKRQFTKAFAVQPDYLFITGWNEFVSIPQSNPYQDLHEQVKHANLSMGLEEDPQGSKLFSDIYGAEYTRDIEPSIEGGDLLYRTMQSCLRVYRSGARTCADTSELCCQNTSEPDYLLIQSYSRAKGKAAHKVVVHGEEAVPAGYREVCVPAQLAVPFSSLPGKICQNGDEKDPAGPFGLWRFPGTDRLPIFRCQSGSHSFLSLHPDCEGYTVDRRLGYVSTKRTSTMGRALRRCYRDLIDHAHTVGGECASEYRFSGDLGYVR